MRITPGILLDGNDPPSSVSANVPSLTYPMKPGTATPTIVWNIAAAGEIELARGAAC